LQKVIANYLTELVHSKEDLEKAIVASNILFGKSTSEDLSQLDEETFLDVFDGVPKANLKLDYLKNNPPIHELLSEVGFLSSKSEINRAIKENSISVNKEKIDSSYVFLKNNLVCGKYFLTQRGKKNYFLISFS
jgi:tyrosyl-tRNA synthetase